MRKKSVRLAAISVAGLAAKQKREATRIPPVDLIEKIKSNDDVVRVKAWQEAGPAGAAAVQPLAVVMMDREVEVARAAKRALWKIVRHAGRPGADSEKQNVASELLPLLKSADTRVRREVLWMLSEIGGNEAVAPMAALLTNQDLREDARLSLQRLPGNPATAALQAAMKKASEQFKVRLAVSLRQRGVQVNGHSSEKLVASKKNSVRANPL